MALRLQGVLEIRICKLELSSSPDASAPALTRLLGREGFPAAAHTTKVNSHYWVKRRFVLTDETLRFFPADGRYHQGYRRRNGETGEQRRADRELVNAKISTCDISHVVPRGEHVFDIHLREGEIWNLRVPSGVNPRARKAWVIHISAAAQTSSSVGDTSLAQDTPRQRQGGTAQKYPDPWNPVAESLAAARTESLGAPGAALKPVFPMLLPETAATKFAVYQPRAAVRCPNESTEEVREQCDRGAVEGRVFPEDMVSMLQQMGFAHGDCVRASSHSTVDDAIEWLLALPFDTDNTATAGGSGGVEEEEKERWW